MTASSEAVNRVITILQMSPGLDQIDLVERTGLPLEMICEACEKLMEDGRIVPQREKP